MLKPKKRKLPQAKKTRKNKSAQMVRRSSPLQAIFNFQSNKDAAILDKVHSFEMAFSMEESKKVIDSYFTEHGYSINQQGVFVPESVVLKAYGYSDLIIALKMQQVDCTDWSLSVDTHFYNLDTDEMRTIPFHAELSGLGYFEIYQEMPIQVSRGAGVKTRWRGLEAELNRAYKDHGVDGFSKVRTDVHIVGSGKFLNIDLYEEFMYLKGVRDLGKIEELFLSMNRDAVEHDILDHNLQPIKHDVTGLPVNVIRNYRKKYEDDGLELTDSFKVGYR